MRFEATRVFSHPIFWGALVLLVVNDHLLKGAGLLPAVLTGKLSDVAGLVVAPWILAFLLRSTTRARVLFAHVLVGAGFAAINLSPPLARAVEEAMRGTPFPWVITVDALDVLTLPALAFSFVVLGAVARQEPIFPRRALVRCAKGVGFAVGLVACVATSRTQPASVWGSLFVVSSIDEPSVITLRALRPAVALDCDFVAEDPSQRLSPDLFAPVQTWELQEGDAVGLTATTAAGCHAWLVGGGGAPGVLVFWRDGEVPAEDAVVLETLQSSPDRSLFLVDEQLGRRFTEHAASYAAPPRELPAPSEGCEAPRAGGLAWSAHPPVGTFVIDQVTASPDGCFALELSSAGSDRRFFLCLDGEALPFTVGETLVIGTSTSAGGEHLVLSGESLVLRVTRGSTLASEPSFVTDAKEGCGGRFDDCGSLVIPALVVVEDAGDEAALSAGESLILRSGTRLYLATSLLSPVLDTACDVDALYLESFSLAEKP